ncbi:MAG: PAS domain S-box protein [Saprospiraceae bacterium]|nr:PAS domain S-box protein [Saprospiraceae bacterium]
MEAIELLEKKLQREIAARQEAERILEEKSLELYQNNQKLEQLNGELESDLIHLFENAVFGIALTSNGDIKTVNSKFGEMMGYAVEELKALTIKDLTYKEDVSKSYQLTNALIAQQVDQFELRKRYRRKDGSLFWAKTKVSPVLNQDGSTRYHLAIIEDIQFLVEAEEKQATLIQTLQSQNKELDAFAQVVSHDLKSPLRAVNTLVGWLKEDHAEAFKGEALEHLQEIESRIGKAFSLIDGILEYAQVGTENTETEVDTKALVKYVSEMIDVPQQFQLSLEGDFPVLKIARSQLQHIFQNLLTNGVKYNDKDVVKILVKSWETSSHYLFSVQDNGIGIPAKYFDKIFTMFSTLNEQTKGTGVGLAIVKKICEHYGGTIIVDSKEGQGTTFTFSLNKQHTKL